MITQPPSLLMPSIPNSLTFLEKLEYVCKDLIDFENRFLQYGNLHFSLRYPMTSAALHTNILLSSELLIQGKIL